MRPAEQVGDDRRLLAGALRDQDAGLAGGGAGQRRQAPVRQRQAARAGRQPPRHSPGRLEQDRAAAAAHAERHHPGGLPVGGAEPVREPGDRAGVRAAERVDRLVGIPDHDQLAPVPRQGVQQGFLRRVGVLVLVHQHRVVGLAFPALGRRAAEQPGRDPDDLRVVVGRNGRQVEAGRVTVEEAPGRDPVVPPAAGAEPGQAAAVQAALGGPEQQVAQLLGEAPGAERGAQLLRPPPGTVLDLAGEHPPHLEQVLGPGQQPRRLVAGQHELPAHQGVRVAVEGERERLAGGTAQPGRDPLPQLVSRLAAEREHEYPRRIGAAAGHPVRHRLDDRGGLPGAGPGEHEQRAAAVADHPLLPLVQPGWLRRRGRPANEAAAGRALVHLHRPA